MKHWLVVIAVLLGAVSLQTTVHAGCFHSRCQDTVEKILQCAESNPAMGFNQCRLRYEVQVRKYCDCASDGPEGTGLLSGALTNGVAPGGGQGNVGVCSYCASNSANAECQQILNMCTKSEKIIFLPKSR